MIILYPSNIQTNNSDVCGHIKNGDVNRCTMLSQQQQSLLCDGYIRNHSLHSILEINRLIQTFWAEHIWWRVTGNQMKEFQNANIGDTICGKKFKIRDITGYPLLFPNGFDKCSGFVQHRIELNIPSNIISITVHFELYCFQTRAHWKSTGYFCDGDENNTLSLKMGKNQIKLSQCQDAQYLDFMHYVDILSIEYKENSDKQNYYKQIKMKQKLEYQWNINQRMLQLFKNGHKGRAEWSQSFNNNCWALFCVPNGSKNIEYVCIGCKLLAIPHQIKQFEIKMIFNIEPNIFHHEIIKRIKSNKIQTAGSLFNTKLTLNDIMTKCSNQSLSINVSIEIVGVWIEENQNLKKIENDEMHKYGIIKIEN